MSYKISWISVQNSKVKQSKVKNMNQNETKRKETKKVNTVNKIKAFQVNVGKYVAQMSYNRSSFKKSIPIQNKKAK